MMAVPKNDPELLRLIGRVQDAAFDCNGLLTRPDRVAEEMIKKLHTTCRALDAYMLTLEERSRQQQRVTSVGGTSCGRI